MPSSTDNAGLFPALLKHWRTQRGLSQLDLALAADVSARHLSFLETGRSSPSAEMVLRLATVLDVPLRQVNAMLGASGHPPAYPEYESGDPLPSEIANALSTMKNHHEPFPLVVIDRGYNLIDSNAGAMALFAAAIPNLGELMSDGPLNLAKLCFTPACATAMINFDEVARTLLWRIQREVLADPDDGVLRGLLDELMSLPTVDEQWRQADLSVPSSPAVLVHMRAGEHELRFVTAVTAFQAPQSVVLDELRIETWYPADEPTAAACRRITGG